MRRKSQRKAQSAAIFAQHIGQADELCKYPHMQGKTMAKEIRGYFEPPADAQNRKVIDLQNSREEEAVLG